MYSNYTIHSISGLTFLIRKEKIQTLLHHMSIVWLRAFSFVIGRCVPLVLFLYSCLPHNKCWQRVSTRTYTTTAKVHVSSDKALCCISFLFSCSQAFRRLLRGDFSRTEGWVLSAVSILFGEDSAQVSHRYVICVFVFFNGSSWRLKVNDRLRIKHSVDTWPDAHTLTHEAHGVGVQCWKWRWVNLIWCEIGWADRLCLTAPLYDV